jgi:hypothetical protein
MKTFDLRKIKRALAHGDIQKVADLAGVKASVVSETLSMGWHPDKRNEIVGAALNVIRDKGENPDLLKEADDMKLATDVYAAAPRKPMHKFAKGNTYGKTYGRGRSNPGNILLYGALAVGAFLLLGGKGLFKTQ